MQLRLLTVDENDALFIIDLPETDFDDLGITGLHGAADELSFNGHFAMAAVDQDAERDALGPPEVEEAVHGGANGAAGVKHVVDEDEIHLVDAEADVGRLQNGLGRDFREIVAIESNVEGADGNVDAIDAAHGFGDALGQRYAAAADAYRSEVFRDAAFLDNLMGQTAQSAVDLRGGHQLGFFDDAHGRVILAQPLGVCRWDGHSCPSFSGSERGGLAPARPAPGQAGMPVARL